MIYLRAFPRVWPSSVNSNEAAVSVEPGNYIMSVNPSQIALWIRGKTHDSNSLGLDLLFLFFILNLLIVCLRLRRGWGILHVGILSLRLLFLRSGRHFLSSFIKFLSKWLRSWLLWFLWRAGWNIRLCCYQTRYLFTAELFDGNFWARLLWRTEQKLWGTGFSSEVWLSDWSLQTCSSNNHLQDSGLTYYPHCDPKLKSILRQAVSQQLFKPIITLCTEESGLSQATLLQPKTFISTRTVALF